MLVWLALQRQLRIWASKSARPLGAIPKKQMLDKWKLIMDLSSLENSSVNDGISKEDCNFHYTSLDTAVEQVSKLRKGCFMAKMDIKSTYRNIPVAPSDRRILGFRGSLHWQSTSFWSPLSANNFFCCCWCPPEDHDPSRYLLGNSLCRRFLHCWESWLTGMPEKHATKICLASLLNRQKQGPVTTITFLGIEINSTAMEIHLPRDKLTHIYDILKDWRNRNWGFKQNLQSCYLIPVR